MGHAFSEFADRFEPDELSEGFDHSMGGNLFTKWNKKSKYWQMYCDLYPILTKKGGSGYPQMYAEEFVKAYESQVAEYKRLGGTEEHLMATVKQHKKNRVPDSAEEERRGLAKG